METTPAPRGGRPDQDARRTVLYTERPEGTDGPSSTTVAGEIATHEAGGTSTDDAGASVHSRRHGRSHERCFLGRYRLLTQYGTSARSLVYRARDTMTRRIVALKLLPISARWDRNREEVDALRSTAHPSVTQILDVGYENGMVVVVMELVKGQLLSSVLHSSRLRWWQAARIALATLEGLDSMHRAGLAHRNVQPSNLVITDLDEARVKIIDFDLIKPLDPKRRTTSLGVYVGSPTYMPPEQLMGLDVDASADVYAVGVVLWQMLTRLDPTKLALTIVEGKVRLWQQVMELEEPGVPKPLWNIVRDMLQPLATRRIEDARSCIERLRPVATPARADEQRHAAGG